MHDKYTYSALVDKMHEYHESQLVVADVLGISDLTLRNKLSGKTDWTIGEIETLCKHYNTNYYELFRKEK
jgi:hypothetical protein